MPENESGRVIIGQSEIHYSISRSKRRRRSIGLMVGRDGGVRVLVPAHAGLASIERLLHRHTGWIARRLDKLYRQREQNPPLRFEIGDSIPYRGENFVLRVTHNADKAQGCTVGNGEIFINLPGTALTPAEQREEIQLEIMLWYKKQAKHVFEERVTLWGNITRLRPRRVIVSNARRQWGSCSVTNDVRLNWRLITASEPILDYVIIHELSHIAHKDHSRRFWRLVESYIPDCKTLRKQLRALDPGFGLSDSCE